MFRSIAVPSRLLAVALVFGAMVSSPVQAGNPRPFKATQTGNAHLTPTDNPRFVRNDETGTGNATHLGLYSWTSVEIVDFIGFPPDVAVCGSFTMTAADGDKLYGAYETTGRLIDPVTLEVQGTFTFTGGTGRFANAAGGGVLGAKAYLSEGLPFEGTFDGTISY
jgi:hypothetical protein